MLDRICPGLAWTPEGKAALDMPAGYVPVAPIIVGHPKSLPPPVPRKEPEIRWICLVGEREDPSRMTDDKANAPIHRRRCSNFRVDSKIRRPDRRRSGDAYDQSRRDFRPDRPQRCGQEHAHQDADHVAARRPRDRRRLRATTSSANRPRCGVTSAMSHSCFRPTAHLPATRTCCCRRVSTAFRGGNAQSASRRALARMGLRRSAHHLVGHYSGGMIRRLEIAQSLLHRPTVLFLDEPTVGLDPGARETVWEHVLDLRDRFQPNHDRDIASHG